MTYKAARKNYQHFVWNKWMNEYDFADRRGYILIETSGDWNKGQKMERERDIGHYVTLRKMHTATRRATTSRQVEIVTIDSKF